MDKYTVDVLQPAKHDMRDIYLYIANELHVPIAAADLLDEIENALGRLAFSPHGNPRVRHERLAHQGYRMLIIRNYIAFFTINEQAKVVEVERILYGRRDWANIL